ncbi:trypsin-like serine protease [Rhizobium ruizarguesonis]|uniref:trypsin-like serine protease n=1 Tax=Rhizobium ruizarguesonis TaxID=2081791 RepID=UPI0013EE73F4|nr:trypsin-like serine protease [Rhizobium ruizarguesonis]
MRYFTERQSQDGATEIYDPQAASVAKPEIFEGSPVVLPEVARITFSMPNGTPALCTGIALAGNKVLTAGHCGCADSSGYRVTFPTNPTARQMTFRLRAAPVVFPGYSCDAAGKPQPGRDLSILTLDQEIAGLRPPPIGQMALPFEDRVKRLFVAGYGRIESGRFPDGLLGAFSRVRDYFCARGYVDGSTCAMFREFVLSDLPSSAVPGADSCDGDSGGPVYWFGAPQGPGEDRKLQEHRFLLGIVSRALDGVPQFGITGCGGGGIYIAVGHVDVVAWLSLNDIPVTTGLNATRFAEIPGTGGSTR